MKKLVIVLTVLMILAGCSQKSDTTEKDMSLTVGVMPSMDAAPLLLAQDLGYFEEEGLELTIHYYQNGNDRESEMNAGLVDGIVTDILGLINSLNAGYDFRATSSTDTLIPLLINPKSEGKTEVSVAMAEISVTNFLAEAYLRDFTVRKEFVNPIPQRLEILQSGIVDMAVVPEPMASQGELNGMIKRVYENEDEYSPNVLVFNQAAITEKKEAIQAFYRAYNKAVVLIQEDDSQARDALISQLNLNPEIKGLISFPLYSKARLFDEAYYTMIKTWIKDNLNIETDKGYSDLVDPQFLQ